MEASQRQVGSLESQVEQMATSLAETRTEAKALATKLAASRSIDTTNNGSSTGQEVVQAMQMKEDLYGDLTGLIVRSIKHEGGEDIYDCIQTGRNGSKWTGCSRAREASELTREKALHFKLSIGEDSTSETYDDAHFTYRPQLDPSRDRELVETLPDYLTEEITFPRPHAAKFYARVTKALTERMEE